MGQIVQSSNAPSALPSRNVRHLLGTVALAELCNRTTEAIRKWDRPKSKGGTGGLIPAEFQARILAYARENNIALSAEDLIAEAQP